MKKDFSKKVEMPPVLRAMQARAEETGMNQLTMAQIDEIIAEVRREHRVVDD